MENRVDDIKNSYAKEVEDWKKTLPDRLRFLKPGEIKVRDAVLIRETRGFRSIHLDGEIAVEDGLSFYFTAVIKVPFQKATT